MPEPVLVLVLGPEPGQVPVPERVPERALAPELVQDRGRDLDPDRVQNPDPESGSGLV